MSEWKEYKIGEIGKVITGKTPRTAITDNYGGKIPFLSPSDDMTSKFVLKTARYLTDKGLSEVKNCLIPKGAICVSCIGSDMGKSVITNGSTVTNQQINSIILNDSFDSNFIYYVMQGKRKEIRFIGGNGTAVPILNKSAFSNLTILAPDLSAQQRIASILSSLDDKIAVNKKICENLEAQAQALFKHWFVDFAPFKDGKFVESELGLIPEGWRVGTLYEVTCNITDGVHNTVKDVANGGYYLLSCKNIKGGVISTGDHERTIDEDTFNKLRKRTKLQKGDILMSSVGTIGEMLLLNENLSNIEFQRSVAMIKPNNDVITPHFLFYSLMNQKEKIIHSAHGAVQQCLFISDIANLSPL